jgi:CubicO group peptidase (beta-lactamase class C family)
LDLKNVVEPWLENQHSPGVSFAIKRRGKLVFQGGFGYRNIAEKLEIDENTIMGTASITKSMTAAGVLILERRGRLSLDDLVVEHIPEMKNISPYWEELKIYHLLSHSSGLAPVKRREDIPDLKEHLSYLEESDLKWVGRPGEYFSYSNDMFLLAGLLIQRVTGLNYKKFLEEQFLKPIGMKRSTFHISQLQNKNNVTVPYLYTSGGHKPCEWPELGNYGVGGALRSTAQDLLKYGEFLLNDPDLLERLSLPRIDLPGGQYAHGLKVHQYRPKLTGIEHSGGQQGVSSHFGVVTAEDMVVVVLSNVSGADAGGLWLDLVNHVLGTSFSRISRNSYQVSNEGLKLYEGIYCSDEDDSVVTVYFEEDHLIAESAGEKSQFKAVDQNTFISKDSPLVIRFYQKSENQNAWGMLVGSRIFLKK